MKTTPLILEAMGASPLPSQFGHVYYELRERGYAFLFEFEDSGRVSINGHEIDSFSEALGAIADEYYHAGMDEAKKQLRTWLLADMDAEDNPLGV